MSTKKASCLCVDCGETDENKFAPYMKLKKTKRCKPCVNVTCRARYKKRSQGNVRLNKKAEKPIDPETYSMAMGAFPVPGK